MPLVREAVQVTVTAGVSMEVGLVHLRGITRLHMLGFNAASIAVARDLGLPVTTGDVTEWSAFRLSDTESGPWPAGAEWA